MAGSNINQYMFLHGELDPAAGGTTDSELYNHGLALCSNVYIQQTGGLYSRPGTKICHVYNTLTDAGKYPRRFVGAKTGGEKKDCVLAISVGRLETFTPYGLLNTLNIPGINVVSWNIGFSIIPYDGKIYLFFNFGIIEVTIDDDYIITAHLKKVDVVPLTPINLDDTSYIVLEKLYGHDNAYRLRFTNPPREMNNEDVGQYINIFFDEEKEQEDQQNVEEGGYVRTIRIHQCVCFKITGFDNNNDCVNAEFVPEKSTFVNAKDHMPIAGVGEDEIRLSRYSIPAFSNTMRDLNSPTIACLYKGRLYLLDPRTRTLYGSSITNTGIWDFSRDATNSTASGIIYQFVEASEIYWMASNNMAICVGTSSGIEVMEEQVPTIKTVAFKKFSDRHASNVSPVVVNSSIFFLDNTETRVFEIAKDEISGVYKTYNTGLLSQHLLNKGVVSFAYSSYPASLVACAMRDGSMLLMGYNRSNDIYAWTQHHLGGDDAHLDTIGSVNLGGQDFFFMCVTRSYNGTLVRSVEYLENNFHIFPDNKYELNYLDASTAHQNVADITSIQFGIPSSVTFDVSLMNALSGELILTSNNYRNANRPFVRSTWSGSLTRITHTGIEKDMPNTNVVAPKAEVFAKCSDVHFNMFSYELTYDDNTFECLLHVKAVGNNNVRPPISEGARILFTEDTGITNCIFLNAAPYSVYSFTLHNGRRAAQGGYVYNLRSEAGYNYIAPNVGFGVKGQMYYLRSVSVTNSLWISIGTGVYTQGRTSIIEYKIPDIQKSAGGIAINGGCNLVEDVRQQVVSNVKVINDNNIVVCCQTKVVTQDRVYYLPNIGGVGEGQGTQFFCLANSNDLEVYGVTDKGHLFKQNLTRGNSYIFRDSKQKFGVILDMTQIGNSTFVNCLNAQNKNVVWYAVNTRVTNITTQLRNRFQLTNGESIRQLNLHPNYIVSNLAIYRLSGNGYSRIQHPFGDAIRSIYFARNVLYVGGVDGLLWAYRNNAWYQILHNRHMSISCIIGDTNGTGIEALSSYGEGLYIENILDQQWNNQNHTVTVARKGFYSGISTMQFCYDVINSNFRYVVAEREYVTRFSFDNRYTRPVIPTTKYPVLIRDIQSFDYLNDKKLQVLAHTYNAGQNLGTLMVHIPFTGITHAYNKRQSGNGKLYFKVFSCAQLSRFYEQTLRITCDGKDMGDKLVTKDHVYMPDGAYTIRVGYPYVQEVKTLDLSGGSVKGSSVGLIARQFTLCLKVLSSSAGEYSSDGIHWFRIPYGRFDKKVSLYGKFSLYTGLLKMSLLNSTKNIITRELWLRNWKAEPLNILSITRDTYVSDN